MNIVFATAEMAPFSKTGGLADVCGALPLALAKEGHHVTVFLPKYRSVDLSGLSVTQVFDELAVSVGRDAVVATVQCCDLCANVRICFIEQCGFFDRQHLYGTEHGDYPDNDRRFIFFQRAILDCLKKMEWAPDIIHCHDWQTALLPAYINTLYRSVPIFAKTKTLLTIHNLAYQGVFSSESFALTGLDHALFGMHALEFYGRLNFLKGGLVFADALTTVSERYAEEICSQEYGAGLDGVLRSRDKDLVGILNGIDCDAWNPQDDPDIAVPYVPHDGEKKLLNKKALQAAHGLSCERDTMLIGIVSRIVHQKGFDILLPILPDIISRGIQFVLVGTGDRHYCDMLRQLGKKYADMMGIAIQYNTRMAKAVYAGADVFMLPSHFEPCGLGQLISLRYGTVPLVRETGGLADTVHEFNKHTGKGNGFVFSEYTSEALLKCVCKAHEWYTDKKMWNKIIANGTAADFSWDVSAKKYSQLYQRMQQKEIAHAE